MINTTVAHYRITEKLGEGGMGEVYRATDTKLNREVALKILPEQFAADEQRMARFQREAEVLASLDHPNIGAIHGIEEAGTTRALVLQLIEGPTLAERIADGPLPLTAALEIALQVAAALEAAHERGIIHRDLKPANIKVNAGGQVKVLDFGLAKAMDERPDSSVDLTQSPTLSLAATQAGIILGTAGYMAPEQARGRPADRRADIWSWGVVLFEMLTGGRAFAGEDVSMVLAHVLSHDPEWAALPPTVPPPIRDLLERCLRKDVERRIQAIGDARIAVEEFLADPEAAPADAGAAAGARAATGSPGLRFWAGLVIAAAVAAAAGWLLKPAPPPRTIHAEAILLAERPLLMMFGSGAVLSPDGSQIVYSTGEHRNPSGQLQLRQTTSLEAAPLSNTEGGYNPFWSPDGKWVGFVTTTELRKVAVSGGASLRLGPVARSRGAAWGPDGTIVVAPNPAGPLMRVSEGGGDLEALTQLIDDDTSHRWPQILPDGRVLFTAYKSTRVEDGELRVLDPETGVVDTLHLGGTYGRFLASGHLSFWREGTVFAAPFRPGARQLAGLPVPLLEGVSGNSEGGAQFDVSADGTMVYVEGSASMTTEGVLSWIDGEGNTTSASTVEAEFGARLALSPDGTKVAVERFEDSSDIWIFDLERDAASRLTFYPGADRWPVWSPDGRFVYFKSDRSGADRIYRVRADGSSQPELILDQELPQEPTSISADGKLLTYNQSHPDTGRDIWVMQLEGEPAPVRFVSTPFVERSSVFSPDGRWIAYQSDESGRFEIYVRPYPGPGGRWQVSNSGGTDPQWSAEGGTLYYADGAGFVPGAVILKVAVTFEDAIPRFSRPAQAAPGLATASSPGWWPHPRDESFLIVTAANDQRATAAQGPIVVRITFNWFEELKQRVPGK